MAEKIEETAVEAEALPPKGKKKRETETPRENSSDLRALLLILLLAVIVFFVLLYKQKHPQEYAESVVQVKEGADAAYSKAEEALPVAYRGIGGFFEYVSDYGKADDLPPELPKVRISQDSTVTEFVSDDSSGSVSSTGSISATGAETVSDSATGALEEPAPLVVEFSGYRIEFDRPPAEKITLSMGDAKMTVGPATRATGEDNASE